MIILRSYQQYVLKHQCKHFRSFGNYSHLSIDIHIIILSHVNQLEAVKLLVTYGGLASVHIQDALGFTPLFLATGL